MQIAPRSEQDIIYEYGQAVLRAESLGLSLRATREDFVLRDMIRGWQQYGRCPTLDDVGVALDARAKSLAEGN